MSGTRHRYGGIRLALFSALVLGALIVPASAQADVREQGGCRAELTSQEGQDSATFTIRCGGGVQGLRFSTTEGAFIVPPVIQPGGPDPTHGFPCLPSGGTPDNPNFTCQSGPPPLGSPGLAPNETGTITFETMDPCGANFAVIGLVVDTGPQGDEATPPAEPEDDVTFTREVPVQGCEGAGPGPEPPGPGPEPPADEQPRDDTRANASDICIEQFSGEGDFSTASARDSNSGDFTGSGSGGASAQSHGETPTQGHPEEFGSADNQYGFDTAFNEVCRDFKPAGGVDAGFGGSSTERANVLPTILAGSALLLFALTSGGLVLLRRR